ncbi:unnamed protein product, partial [Discosporangium mesarthrocarpum]
MSERDWRTVSKALYLLHCILRDIPPKADSVLKLFLMKVLCSGASRRTC